MLLQKHIKLADKIQKEYNAEYVVVQYHVVYLWINGGKISLMYDNTPKGLFKVIDTYFSYHSVQERAAFVKFNNTKN